MVGKATKPYPMFVGLVAKKVKGLMEDGASFDEAYKSWYGEASDKVKAMDWEDAGVMSSLKEACGCGGKSKPKKPKDKKDEEPETQAVKAAAALSGLQNRKFANPTHLKLNGPVELEEHDGAMLVRLTNKTRGVGVKCPQGSHGEKIDESIVGCVVDEQPGDQS